jgi:hypothetical protein
MPSQAPRPGFCGAKLPNSSPAVYCERRPLLGRNRCAKHGGKTLRGAAHPNYAGKGRSVDLPTRLADRWRDGTLGAESPDLTSQRKAIGLLDERVAQLLERLDTNEAGRAWDSIREAHAEIRSILRNSLPPEVQDWVHQDGQLLAQLDNIRQALHDSKNERDNWKEVFVAAGLRTELADTEHRRDTLAHKVMTDREAQAFTGALQLAVMEVASAQLAPEAKRAFLEGVALRFKQIMHAPGAPGPVAALPAVSSSG